jgi:hypothetical protein
MELIARLPNLQYLVLTGGFTARGVNALARSTSLESVELYSTSPATDAAFADPFARAGRVKNLRILKCSEDVIEEVAKWGDWYAMPPPP